MATTAEFACAGCRWWLFQPTEGSEQGPAQAVGYCRRFPPVRKENGVGAWPITFGNDWCGEYTDKSAVTWPVSRGLAPAH